MSSLVEEIQLLKQVARDLQTSRYLTVASFVALTWDIMVTLEDEVTLIWKSKWTLGKALFFATRYPILLEAIVWLAYTLDFNADSTFCSFASYLDGWSTLVFIIPVQLIVVLRTIALWDKKRVIVIVLFLAMIVTDAVMATSIGLVSKSLVFKPNPMIQPVFGCESGLVSLNTNITVPAWAALMGFDTVIFVLTLIKVIEKVRFGRTRLLSVLFRDGFAYYSFMLATSAANLVIYSALPMSRRGLIDAMLQVLRSTMAIIGARIVLNVRGVIVDPARGPDSLNTSRASAPGKGLASSGVCTSDSDSPVILIGYGNA